jgi:hypothetical protein
MMGRIVYYRLVLFETNDSEDPEEVMKDLKGRASEITSFLKEKGYGVSSFVIVAGGNTEQAEEASGETQ